MVSFCQSPAAVVAAILKSLGISSGIIGVPLSKWLKEPSAFGLLK
jgi:hypothetical protein